MTYDPAERARAVVADAFGCNCAREDGRLGWGSKHSNTCPAYHGEDYEDDIAAELTRAYEAGLGARETPLSICSAHQHPCRLCFHEAIARAERAEARLKLLRTAVRESFRGDEEGSEIISLRTRIRALAERMSTYGPSCVRFSRDLLAILDGGPDE